MIVPQGLRSRTVRIGAALAAFAVVPVLAAPVASADPTPSGAPHLAAACGRLPHRIERVERLQTRFHASATTRGSIAFLSARIDKAKAEGHTDLARVLEDRLAVRRDIDSQLGDVLGKLKDARQVCATHPAAPSTSASASS